LYDDVDFQRFPAIIIYDTLHSPSTSLYQNGIFTLCADGLCSPFLDEKKRLKLKNQLDSLNSSEIKIVNKNFDEREDMLRNVIGGEETFIYKKIQCTILYSYCGVKNFFVTNFKKENSNEQDYLGFHRTSQPTTQSTAGPCVLRSPSADQDLFPPVFRDIFPQEYPLPLSSRLGIFHQTDSLRLIAFNSPGFDTDGTFLDKTSVDTLSQTAPSDSCGIAFPRGGKRYELSNHLGNVLAVISDRKLQVLDGGMSLGHYFTADIWSARDYYPFGMGMGGRSIDGVEYSVNFEVNGIYKTQEEVEKLAASNTSAENNFIRIEDGSQMEFKSSRIVFGGNTGIFVDKELGGNKTTDSHEYGHGLKWFDPEDDKSDVESEVWESRGFGMEKIEAIRKAYTGRHDIFLQDGIPGIMTPKGTSVKDEYGYNSQPSGKRTLDPSKRKVLPSDITKIGINIEELKTKGKTNVGKATNTLFKEDGTQH
jgi:hypothetical protein